MTVGSPTNSARGGATRTATLIAPTDGELIMRHRTSGDDGALAELLARHAAMVWAVCRGVLRREQDAEDAFQATLLILIERGHTVRACDSAAGWLYRVALRAALAKKRAAARRREEPLADDPPAPEVAFPDIQRRRMTEVLMEELRGLPDKYQTPLVLRYLEGQSRRAIAAQTDTTVAAVQGRLARGKRLLRSRLARRGVSLSLAMGVLAGETRASAATIHPAAHPLGALASASPAVQSLVHQGVRSMILSASLKPVLATIGVALVTSFAAVAADPSAGDSPEGAGPELALMSEVDGRAIATEEAVTHLVQDLTAAPVAAAAPAQRPSPPGEPTLPGFAAPGDATESQLSPENDGVPVLATPGGTILRAPLTRLKQRVHTSDAPSEATSKQLKLERDYWNLKAEALREKAMAMMALNGVLDDAQRRSAEGRVARADAKLLQAEAMQAEAKALELSERLEQPARPTPAGPHATRVWPGPALGPNASAAGRPVFSEPDSRAQPGVPIPPFAPAAAKQPDLPPSRDNTPQNLAAGDTIRIHVTNALTDEPIKGEYAIEPAGTVALGPSYGRALVAGMTVLEAEKAIREKLAEVLEDPVLQVTRPPQPWLTQSTPEGDWSARANEGAKMSPDLMRERNRLQEEIRSMKEVVEATREAAREQVEQLAAQVKELAEQRGRSARRMVQERRVEARQDGAGATSSTESAPFEDPMAQLKVKEEALASLRKELEAAVARAKNEQDAARANAEQRMEEARRAMQMAEAKAAHEQQRAEAERQKAASAQADEQQQRIIAVEQVHWAEAQNAQLKAELKELQAAIKQLRAQREGAEKEAQPGVLKPGDQIQVEAIALVKGDNDRVSDHQRLSGMYFIEPMGTIPLGAALGRVEIAGKPIREAESLLEAHLRERSVKDDDVVEYRVQIIRRSR